MPETPQSNRLKTTVPSVAEQLANPTGLSAELTELRELIGECQEMTFRKLRLTQRRMLAMLSLNFGNRRISRAWVSRLKRVSTENRWEEDNPHGLVFDSNGYLRDGQHRLLALAETGNEVSMWCAFHVPPKVFSALDVGMRRSGAQSLELDGIKNANHIQAILRLQHRLATGGEKLDDQGVYLRGHEVCDGSDMMPRALAAGFRMHEMAAVSAAAYAFWKIAIDSPDRGRLGDFWDQLVRGYGQEDNSPVLQVRRLLSNARTAAKKPHQTMQQTLSVVWIIWAWNQWVVGATGGRPPRWTRLHEVLPVRGAS